MKIILKNFKCYTDATYEIKDQQITLLSGASGSGKTSIIQSICWCLYGKMRGVYNNKTTGKCSVTIILQNFKIYRQARSSLLQITLGDGSVYEDLVAQQMIDNAYGERTLWYACSYIAQDSKALLLSGSNSDRMNLLNTLSFSSSSSSSLLSMKPEESINRIDFELKNHKKEFDRIQTEYNTELSIFQADASRDPTVFSYHLPSQELKDAKEVELKGNQNKYIELIEERKNQNQILGKISMLQQTVNTRKKELSIMKDQQKNYIVPSNIDYEKKISEVKNEREQLIKTYQNEKEENESKLIVKEKEEKSLKDIMSSEQLVKDRIYSIYESKNKEKERIEVEIKNYEQYIEMYSTNVNKFEEALNGLNKIKEIIDKENITQDMYKKEDEWNAKSHEDQYQIMKEKATNLSLNYDDENIQTIINEKIQDIRKRLDYLSTYEQKNKLRSTLNLLEQQFLQYSNIQSVSDEEINVLGGKIHELKQGLNLLECPHCKGSLRIQGQTLIPSDLHKVDPSLINEKENELKQLNYHKSKYGEKVNLQKQIDSFRNLMNDNSNEGNNEGNREEEGNKGNNEEKILSNEEILNEKNQLNQILAQYQEIKIYKLPKYSSQTIHQILSYYELKKSYDQFLSNNNIEKVKNDYETRKIKLKEIEDEFGEILKEKVEFEKTVEERNSHLMKLHEITNKISELKVIIINENNQYERKMNEMNSEEMDLMRKKSQDEINRNNFITIVTKINELEKEVEGKEKELKEYQDKLISDIDAQIQVITSQIQGLQVHIEKAKICDRFYERQTRLNKKREVILEMHKDLTALGTMRQIAIDLECKLLQSTVDRINSIMSDILDEIFDHPITVTLKLYKKIKSNKRIKPSVNLTVSYKGIEYDGINMLSGGESDRISISLIIAMSRISSSPFLLLDESMKSINDSLRFKSIKSLRSILGDIKTIICVNHEDTEGNYDEVIPIGSS